MRLGMAADDPTSCGHAALSYGGGCWHCPTCGGAVDPDELT